MRATHRPRPPRALRRLGDAALLTAALARFAAHACQAAHEPAAAHAPQRGHRQREARLPGGLSVRLSVYR